MTTLNQMRPAHFLVSYPLERFPFPALVQDHVLTETNGWSGSLALLHERYPAAARVGVDNDQATDVLTMLYRIDRSYHSGEPGPFLLLYDRFVRWLRTEVFPEALIYQKKPTLRCQLPHNLSVGAFHRDSDYGHPAEEINVFVPLTRCRDTATIQLESAPDRGDFEPVPIEVGQLLLFDSGCRHGNVVNDTGFTRVSFDFRVIPVSQWRGDQATQSETQRIPFTLGGYYAQTDV